MIPMHWQTDVYLQTTADSLCLCIYGRVTGSPWAAWYNISIVAYILICCPRVHPRVMRPVSCYIDLLFANTSRAILLSRTIWDWIESEMYFILRKRSYLQLETSSREFHLVNGLILPIIPTSSLSWTDGTRSFATQFLHFKYFIFTLLF